ncbi:RING-H2 finger protein ATL56-like [Aristolochia californica]|uniref:RING-H2 finger protein ATL56-like n=1 Tax=Aristolochia californica TaxID=171875 RepID=UPI0035DC5FFE
MASAEDEEYGFRRLDYDPPNGAGNPPRLTPPPLAMMPTKPNSKFLSFLLQAVVMALVVSLFFLFLGIASLILIHICIAGRALRHRRGHRRAVDAQLCVATPIGLSLKEVQKLPSCSYAGTGPTAAATDCPVCLDGFKDAERCRVLPRCGHVFHVHCVDRWLMKVPACPVCRSGVEGLVFGDDEDGLGV